MCDFHPKRQLNQRFPSILAAVFEKITTVDLAKLNDSELDLNTSMMYRHEDYVDALPLPSFEQHPVYAL